MTIKSAFNFGESVYVKTDPDQAERIITGLIVRPNGAILYLAELTTGLDSVENSYFEIQLSREVDVVKKMQINNYGDEEQQ